MTRRNSCSTLPARANRSGVWSRRQPSHYMTLYGAPRHRMAVIQLTISHKKRETFILKSVKNDSLLKEGNTHFTASYGSLKKDPRELSDWRLIHNVKFSLRRLASFVHFFWDEAFQSCNSQTELFGSQRKSTGFDLYCCGSKFCDKCCCGHELLQRWAMEIRNKHECEYLELRIFPIFSSGWYFFPCLSRWLLRQVV